MTSREKVLNVYPDAWRGLTGVFIPGHGEEDAIRIGRSWKSIASKLPPGSPAGETAPIAPAAEDATEALIEQMRVALEAVTPWIHSMASDKVKQAARKALTRAEEYRKGAKNA